MCQHPYPTSNKSRLAHPPFLKHAKVRSSSLIASMPMTFLTMLMYLGTALAELLYKAAMIPPHARILDIGHGCGDSLLVLAKQYEPACLNGVTSVPAHAHRARERLGYRATVWCADVVRWIRSDQATHSIYDVILALDLSLIHI